MNRIYLDHAATTPLNPDAASAMRSWLQEGFGNPSSLHADGRKAKDAIDDARATISTRIGALFAEVLFTSGGTEAANLALIGLALEHQGRGRDRILLGAAEHHCVLHTVPTLRALGYQVDFIPVDSFARIDLQALEDMLDDHVLAVSAMHANNELGTVNPVTQIAQSVHHVGALLHVDAVQTFLRPVPDLWSVHDLDADIVTFSAHKVYGPKGAGAIYIRAGVKLKPLVVGGGQEREMRGGTENVVAIVGFAAAVNAFSYDDRALLARQTFLQLVAESDFVRSVPDGILTLDGHAHLRHPAIDAETMLILLDRMGISASSGSACSSGSIEPSHVLLACGYSPAESKSGLRFTFGCNTIEEAKEAAERLLTAKNRILGTR